LQQELFHLELQTASDQGGTSLRFLYVSARQTSLSDKKKIIIIKRKEKKKKTKFLDSQKV
jgi:hypothetical protein